jgi:glycosyltransferase involved in cell wall biosynthesis
MADAPLVSVVMPVFNGESFLAQAIESVLAQTWSPVETIVVDDGSTDRSTDIARGYPVTYVRQEHSCVAAARNRGVAGARGELVSFLDHDDVWVPRKLELQVDALARNPSAGICMCRFETFMESGADVPAWVERPGSPDRGASYSTGQLGTLLVRREVFDEVGLFDTGYPSADDTDWFLRTKDLGVEVVTLDEPLQRYRIHNASISASRDPGERQRLRFRLLQASIRRKRALQSRGS